MSPTGALMSSLDDPCALTSPSIFPTANISLITPNGPLGLAATTARPAMKGARWICFHSSAEKSAFVAIPTSFSVDRTASHRRKPRCSPSAASRPTPLSLWAALSFDHGQFDAAVLSSTFVGVVRRNRIVRSVKQELALCSRHGALDEADDNHHDTAAHAAAGDAADQ